MSGPNADTSVKTRSESDSMGAMAVPADAYYGAQTRRAELNFHISPLRLPRTMIRAMGLIKKSAAIVNKELGLLDAKVADAISQAAQEVADGKLDSQFVVDIFQTGSGTSSNMNTNEVVAGRANEILTGTRGGRDPVHPNDHVNLGQSSNDVFPTAIHVSACDALRTHLVPSLGKLLAVLAAKAKEFDQVVKIGRTHLQDAVPIRLGQEFSGYAAQVEHALKRAEQAFQALAELPIGGTAVGTGINTHAEFPQRMAAQLSRETTQPFHASLDGHAFENMANRDAAVEASGQLRTIAVSLSNIANNIRWLASGPRCGIGEIHIPELQPGSSIMPGKVNPVIPEAVMMVAAQVVGNDATIAWANGTMSQFELSVGMPVLAYNLLQSIDLLSNAATHLADKCVDARAYFESLAIKPPGVTQIEATSAAADSVEKSLAMCTALAPVIGYDAAAAIAKTAYKTGQTVREVAVSLAGKPGEVATQALSLGKPLKGTFPTVEEIASILEAHGQTVRGTGVGRAAGG
jgi:fumarate hydratase class II